LIVIVKPLTQLERFLDRITSRLTPEDARELVDFRFDSATQAYLAELAEKANEGSLTEEERGDYTQYIEVADLIGILQARARGILRQHGA